MDSERASGDVNTFTVFEISTDRNKEAGTLEIRLTLFGASLILEFER